MMMRRMEREYEEVVEDGEDEDEEEEEDTAALALPLGPHCAARAGPSNCTREKSTGHGRIITPKLLSMLWTPGGKSELRESATAAASGGAGGVAVAAAAAARAAAAAGPGCRGASVHFFTFIEGRKLKLRANFASGSSYFSYQS